MALSLAWQIAIGGALSVFGYLTARRNRPKIGTSKPATRRQVTTEVIPERYVLGRARIAPVITDGFTSSSTNQVERRVVHNTDIHLIGVIGSGPCEAIERMWVDNEGKKEEVPLIRVPNEGGDVLFPTKESGWQGTLLVREYFRADGTQGQNLQKVSGGQFSPSNRYEGVSWVSIQIQQGYQNNDTNRKNGVIFRGIPTFEFLVKGLKTTWPGQTVPTWSESASSKVWWLLRERMKVPEDKIDIQSFIEAERVSSEELNPSVREGYIRDEPRIRYSINGVVNGEDRVEDVLQSFNWCWQGSTPIINGLYTALPGAIRNASFAITDEDIEEGSLSAIRISSPIKARVNSLKCNLPQSSSHSWTSLGLVYDDRALQERDRSVFQKDVGDTPYTVHPYEGGRLLAIATRLLSGRAYRFTLSNNPTKLAGITVGSQGTFKLDVEGITTPIYGVIDSAMLTREHTTEVLFRELPDGVYADTVVHPPEVPSSANFNILQVLVFDSTFQGYLSNVSRWRWGFGERVMLVPDGDIGGPVDRLDGSPLWPFGVTPGSNTFYRTTQRTLGGGNFEYVRVDPVWKSPDDATRIDTLIPTKIDVEISSNDGESSWVETTAGSWVDLSRRGIETGNGVRAVINFEGSENVALTGVTITLAKDRSQGPQTGGLSEEDQEYRDSIVI